jgi:hypothetical protein
VKRSPIVGVLAAALVGVAIAAVPAHAAPIGPVALGRVTPAGTSQCLAGQMWVQGFVNPDKPPVRTPFAGVITSVSSYANDNPNGQIQAVFLTPTDTITTYLVAQRSPVLTLAPGRLNTFPVRIPVAADETFGLRAVGGQPRCEEAGGLVDQDFIGALDDSASSWMLDSSHTQKVVNLSVVWEPDQDGDGYGDVSQDGCPSLAAVHDPCPAPVVTVTKKPAKRTAAHRVKVKFQADVAGSAYACSVDGRAFKPCRSPYKGSFLAGTHTVRIQATSPVGVTGEPVTVQFKVKPRR